MGETAQVPTPTPERVEPAPTSGGLGAGAGASAPAGGALTARVERRKRRRLQRKLQRAWARRDKIAAGIRVYDRALDALDQAIRELRDQRLEESARILEALYRRVSKRYYAKRVRLLELENRIEELSKALKELEAGS